MTDGRLKSWFIVAVAATVAAVITYAVSFSIAFDRSDVGQPPGPAGAIVWPAALVSLAGLIAPVVLLAVWLSRRGSREVSA
jgi:anti-sigma-K factor RskA